MVGSDISVLVMAVERLAESQSDTNRKVDKLIESMGKQEVILEKLANIEKNHQDSVKRVYHVIDEIKVRQDKVDEWLIGAGCPAHKSFVSKHDEKFVHSLSEIETLKTELNTLKNAPREFRSMVLKGLFGSVGALIVTWVIWSISQIGKTIN